VTIWNHVIKISWNCEEEEETQSVLFQAMISNMSAFLLKQWFSQMGCVSSWPEGRKAIKIQFLMSDSAAIIFSAILNHLFRKYLSELLILMSEELAFGIFRHHLLANKTVYDFNYKNC
jgi:hypothetical protein